MSSVNLQDTIIIVYIVQSCLILFKVETKPNKNVKPFTMVLKRRSTQHYESL